MKDHVYGVFKHNLEDARMTFYSTCSKQHLKFNLLLKIFINSQDFIVRCKMLKPDLKVKKSSVYLTLMTSRGSACSIRSEFTSTMTRISTDVLQIGQLHVNSTHPLLKI